MVKNYGITENGYEKYSFHTNAFIKLSKDSSLKVRRTMASHLHELLHLLEKTSIQDKLVDAFQLFLNDYQLIFLNPIFKFFFRSSIKLYDLISFYLKLIIIDI